VIKIHILHLFQLPKQPSKPDKQKADDKPAPFELPKLRSVSTPKDLEKSADGKEKEGTEGPMKPSEIAKKNSMNKDKPTVVPRPGRSFLLISTVKSTDNSRFNYYLMDSSTIF